MKSPPIKNQTLVLIKDIHSRMIEENKADRLAGLERTITILQGNLEVKEQRMRAMEDYLGVKFKQESKYEKA